MTQIIATDLWFPSQQDPIGRDHGGNFRNYNHTQDADDPVRYIVWVDAGRLSNGRYGFRPELAPRQAFHLVACSNAEEVDVVTDTLPAAVSSPWSRSSSSPPGTSPTPSAAAASPAWPWSCST